MFIILRIWWSRHVKMRVTSITIIIIIIIIIITIIIIIMIIMMRFSSALNSCRVFYIIPQLLPSAGQRWTPFWE